MKQDKTTIKTYFETGDKPTQEQYSNLVDSYVDSKQPEGEANRRFVINETGEVNVAPTLNIPEYTLSEITGNKLALLKDGITVKEIDLTQYIDDTNLSRLASGTVDSAGIATFKRDDNSTFTVDFSSLVGASGNQTQADWNQTDTTQVDFIKNKPDVILDNNFVVVKAENATHTPKIGSFDSFFNNLDDVFTELESLKFKDTNFKIIIASDGVFPITKEFSNIQGLSIYSEKKAIIKLQNFTFNVTNCNIYMPNGEIHATRYAYFNIWKNAKVILNRALVLDEGAAEESYSLCPINFVNSSNDYASILFDINEFYVDTTTGQSGSVFKPTSEKYDNINVKIGKIIYKKTSGNSYIDCFTNIRRGVDKDLHCKIDVGEIDLTDCTIGKLQVFNGLGTYTSWVKSENFNSGGCFDLSIGSIKNPNQISAYLFSNTRNANINMRFKNSFIEGVNNLLMKNNGGLGYNAYVKFSGKVKTNSSTYLLHLGSWSVEKTDYNTVEILLQELEWINEGTGMLFYTRLYGNQNAINTKVDPRIKIIDCHFKANGMLGEISDTTNDDPITDSSVLFLGENKIDVNGAEYLLKRPENGVNHIQVPNAVVNYGKIFHNAVNADFPDTRSIKEKESIFTHQL
ncbi:hypothetical protein [Tenacibaculum sp. nBUS_03]|uniref:hypothetical protein n=1 Tax=Tenacibaculum sp. nBUS_03 TaxID=3395320 RepID=UPI003EB6E0C3